MDTKVLIWAYDKAAKCVSFLRELNWYFDERSNSIHQAMVRNYKRDS